MPSTSNAGPIWDWFFGHTPQTAQTTYMPPYIAPAYTATYAAPVCDPCSAPAYATPTFVTPTSGCSSCAPQAVQYTPYASYRPISVARSVTAYYYPRTAYNTYATPAAAYYAPLAWTQQVRMIPYSTYRMAYMPVTYVGYAPAYTSCASPCVSNCASPCEYANYGGTVTYGSSSCASCQPVINSSYTAPITQTPSSLAPITSSAPATDVTPQPKTFQEQKPAEDTRPSLMDNKTTAPDSTPSTYPELKPIPRTDTQLNSMPEPRLIDPENRTTSVPVRQAIHFTARATTSAQPAVTAKTSAWRESRD